LSVRPIIGFTILAAGIVISPAATAQESNVIVCRIDIEPVHVYTDPIRLKSMKHETYQRVRKLWQSIALNQYGKGADQMKRWDDRSCDIISDYDAFVRSNFSGFSYKTFKRVPFPVERIYDGSAVAESEPSLRVRKAGGPPRADIIIEDAKPTQATPAQLAQMRLTAQREYAARAAKAAADHARHDAEIQARIKKFFEEAKKRGNAQ
jgi:hypothetical protein